MSTARSRHQRRSIRLRGCDYSSPGAYFVTICVRKGECLLGTVIKDEMSLSPFGEIAQGAWAQIPARFPTCVVDAFVIMPNHVHATVSIQEEGEETSPLRADGADTDPRVLPLPGRIAAIQEKGEETSPLHAEGADTDPRTLPTLGQIVAYYKYQTTKAINQLRGTPGTPFWQRNYWEHVIRNEPSCERIGEFILTNPARWEADQLNPAAPRNRFNRW